jgi:hypothetical protein
VWTNAFLGELALDELDQAGADLVELGLVRGLHHHAKKRFCA